MKITITGTTSGLGQALKNNLADHELKCLDRPNFDLDKNLDDYVSNDFDVYINNAYSKWAQIDLLYKLFEVNKTRTCKIICIGSVSADGNYDYPNPYAIHKAALDGACHQLQLMSAPCKVFNVKLGRMDTPMSKEKLGSKLDPNFVATEIIRLIHLPSNVVIKTLTLDNSSGRKSISSSIP